MAIETFSASGGLHADWSEAANWSSGAGGAGTVPGAGTQAIVNAVDAWIDPGTSLSAIITLEGGAGLIGNQAGFSFTSTATLYAVDDDAIYANGAIVNDGTIAVVGGNLRVVVEAGSNIAQSYGLAEPSFENTRDIDLDGGTLAIDGSQFSNVGTVFISNSGVLSLSGGWMDGGQTALPPGGDIDIGGGGLASFSDGVIDQDFFFNGPGTIVFDDPADVRAIGITDFGYRDEILVPSITQAQNLIADSLTFTTALPPMETLAIVPIAGGAEIVALGHHEVPPCFARGTRILTPAGYVPVERLRPGDLVVTVAGKAETLRWVGSRSVDLAAHRRPDAVLPIRITAGALAEGVPARDVQLSPDHALWLDHLLVPVKYLVNNATILRDRDCLAVTYFHLELETHSVILAENMPVETYLDTGNRGNFAHQEGTAWRSPVFGRGTQWNEAAYAPLCIAGPKLRAIRQKLFDRLAAQGYRHRIMPDVSLMVDGVKVGRSFGMAWLPCFRLPGHGGKITIRSATFVPGEMAVGPSDEEDWRVLGVGLRRIRVDHQIFTPHILAIGGFHPRGAGDIVDWTDGNATIAVPPETTIIGLNILALPKAWLIMPPGVG
jgi:hypothetical protein